MYGMINTSLQYFVTEIYGQGVWRKIKSQLQISAFNFKDLEAYPDHLTLDIVDSLAAETHSSREVILQSFGNFWIAYARQSNYAGILDHFAITPWEFIEALDALHHRLGLIFEELKPPSFWVIEKSERAMLVGYRSDRGPGFEPFVVGLFKGIFRMFHHQCQVEIQPPQLNETARFYVSQ